MITRDWASNLASVLERIFSATGLHVALSGSCLFHGQSQKDVDFVVYPHDSTVDNVCNWYAITAELDRCGWVRTNSVDQMHRYWRSKNSTDRKHVEVWRTPNGERIDFIVMGVFS